MNKNKIIKFRVWDNLLNEWGDPSAFLGVTNRGFLISENDSNTLNSIIQQFTGLLDKNNKEIYEGDILILENMNPVEVKFSRGMFGVDSSKYEFGNDNEPLDEHLSLVDDIECVDGKIIGNIFENPELLKF